MLHYIPQHVSSSTLLIFRRTNYIITASGIFTLCKQPYSVPVESGLQSAVNRLSGCVCVCVCVCFIHCLLLVLYEVLIALLCRIKVLMSHMC